MEKLDLKVGDKVIVMSRCGTSLREVERITPKGAIRVAGTLYTEFGSQKGGDPWGRSSIKKATEEDIREIKEKTYIAKTLRAMHECRELTYENAVEIMKILEGTA